MSQRNTSQYHDSVLGKITNYTSNYNANLLFQLPRLEKRLDIGLDPENLPFQGFDLWTHYEVSWLNTRGKPIVAIAEISYSSDSLYIVESKSLKLYFNSFNGTQFPDEKVVLETIKNDLEKIIQLPVQVSLQEVNSAKLIQIKNSFDGVCIDHLDIQCDSYLVDPSLLSTSNQIVTETLCSDLLKSNCLVTNQPDWGSVLIHYKGKQISHEGLLKYIVSYRNHNEFHEQCIERIFMDILSYCSPEQLTVYGRYTRRGGLDINPYRSTQPFKLEDNNYRLIRQ